MSKIFKGFKQVTITQFNEYKDANNLDGYLWFVRTPVVIEGETVSDTANDEYDIYFGKKHYGHFCEGELTGIKDTIDVLREDLGFAPGSFEFGEGVTTIKGAFDSIASMLTSITNIITNNSSEIEQIKVDASSLNDRVSELEKIDHEAYADADSKVLEAAIDEVNKLANGPVKENADAIAVLNNSVKENTDAIAVLNGTGDGSVSKQVADAIAGVVANAPEDFDTLKEIAEYIKSDKSGAAELSNRISALEEIDHDAYIDYTNENFVKLEGFNEFTQEMEDKLDAIEEGAQVNKVEGVKVNGVEADIDENKVASLNIDSQNIELGVTLTADGKEKYSKNTKVSDVLQGIQNSITQAAAGSYLGVVNGNGINVSEVIGNQQTISVKLSNEEGNLLTVSENGLFAAMFYDGDDSETPSDFNRVNYRFLIENGGDVVLRDSLLLPNAVVLSNVDSVVDLNGNKVQGGLFAEQNGNIVKGDSDSYAFWVKDGASLVINGDGVIETQAATYSMAVWAQGGTVTINGGTYINNGEGSDLIYASNGGKVYIYGGTFKPCEKQTGVSGTMERFSALNIKDKDRGISEIKVYGGKFYGFNPANNTSEGENTNFVAEGYKAIEIETGVWEVVPE